MADQFLFPEDVSNILGRLRGLSVRVLGSSPGLANGRECNIKEIQLIQMEIHLKELPCLAAAQANTLCRLAHHQFADLYIAILQQCHEIYFLYLLAMGSY